MSHLSSSLKKRVRASGRDLKSIATDAGVSYYKLSRWVRGKTKVLDIADYDKLKRLLTGEGVEP